MPKRILIAEDETALSDALASVVKSLKYDHLITKDGEETLKALKASTFDLVLLDIIIPKMNGLNVLKSMREAGDKTPVIILTNLNDQGSINTATTLGATFYIIKSDSSLKDVKSLIEKALAP